MKEEITLFRKVSASTPPADNDFHFVFFDLTSRGGKKDVMSKSYYMNGQWGGQADNFVTHWLEEFPQQQPPQQQESSEDIDNSGTEFLKGVLQSGEAEEFLEKMSFCDTSKDDEIFISEHHCKIYARMKVREEKARCKKIFEDYEKLNNEIREDYRLLATEHEAVSKISHDRKSELEQLKAVSRVDGVVPNNDKLESLFPINRDSEQNYNYENEQIQKGAKWMRDRLMPLIKKGEDDDKFEFLRWAELLELKHSKWHDHNGVFAETDEELYQKFLSRLRDDGGKV